jgi:hypothetical protein
MATLNNPRIPDTQGSLDNLGILDIHGTGDSESDQLSISSVTETHLLVATTLSPGQNAIAASSRTCG